MPNAFITLEVPHGEGSGLPVVTGLMGHPKTFVLAGAVRPGARYLVEGSNDGGVTWDILVDDNDGTQVLFTSRASGAKSVDCIVERVRVRAIGGGPGADPPPSITMGAPPSSGPGFFGKLDVPASSGLGAPLDLGLNAGPLKTFILRGAVPPGGRYSILGSMDGAQFDEVMLFSADQQGARSRLVMCRFLRVRRNAGGPTPAIAVGAEALAEHTGGGGGVQGQLLITDEGRRSTTDQGTEEVLAEYPLPLGSLPWSQLRASLAAFVAAPGNPGGQAKFRIRLRGTPGQPDGDEIVGLEAGTSGEVLSTAVGPPFARPAEAVTVVKVTGQGNGTAPAVMRGALVVFSSG